MSRIAIIGAGIGGLTLAHALVGRHDVVVFEKGRGVGGRMASRHAGAFSFDHGAQYFTIRDPRCVALLEPMLAAGEIAPWVGPIARFDGAGGMTLGEPRDVHYVGVPNMNNLTKALATGVTIKTGVDIAPLGERSADGWLLVDAAGISQGSFDWLISSTTPHQTIALLGPSAPDSGPLVTSKMLACYALMLGFDTALELPWIAARISGSAIEWVGVNSSKPGRSGSGTTLVVHSTSEWAEAHLGQENETLGALLEATLRDATGINATAAVFRTTHRWRSARRAKQADSPPYVDATKGLAATGDWTTGSRVENVILSALDLAEQIGRNPSVSYGAGAT